MRINEYNLGHCVIIMLIFLLPDMLNVAQEVTTN